MIVDVIQKDEFKDFLGCFKIVQIGDIKFMDLLFKRYANPFFVV